MLCLLKQYIINVFNFIKNKFIKQKVNGNINNDITVISCKIRYIQQKEQTKI